MNEFELISRLIPVLPVNETVRVGAGDDCAVLDSSDPEAWLLLKTDAVVENVHFTPETEPERVGRKALARCLSDVAAMGGTPTHALVTLLLPRGFDPGYVERLYRGLTSLARQYGVAVVGGETAANPAGTAISVAVLGRVSRTRCLLRSGAQPGDAIFVTGELGGSIKGKHLDFEPRLREARWLGREFDVHAMIDLSDGLAGDLPHLLRASGVGAELHERAIPISREARLLAKEGPHYKPALLSALTDGEDFELLFTVASGAAVGLLDAWKAEFPGLKLSCVGRVIAGEGWVLRGKNNLTMSNVHGFTHFQ